MMYSFACIMCWATLSPSSSSSLDLHRDLHHVTRVHCQPTVIIVVTATFLELGGQLSKHCFCTEFQSYLTEEGESKVNVCLCRIYIVSIRHGPHVYPLLKPNRDISPTPTRPHLTSSPHNPSLPAPHPSPNLPTPSLTTPLILTSLSCCLLWLMITRRDVSFV